MKSPTEQLVAERISHEDTNGEYCKLVDMLRAELKARIVAESRATGWENISNAQRDKLESAESRLRVVEAETIKRCAKVARSVFDDTRASGNEGSWYQQGWETASDRIENELRALAPDRTAAAQVSSAIKSDQGGFSPASEPAPAAAIPSAPFIVTETANGTAAAPTLGKFSQSEINAKAEASRLEVALHSTQYLLAAAERRWQRDIEIVSWRCIEICRNLGADAAADAIRASLLITPPLQATGLRAEIARRHESPTEGENK